MHQNLIVADRYPGVHSYSTVVDKIKGKSWKLVVDVCIYIVQINHCISYLYFIAEQADGLVCHYTADSFGQNGYCNNKNVYIALLTIPILPFSWIETYTFLSYFSMAGISMAVIALLMMTSYMIAKETQGTNLVSGQVEVFNAKGILQHLGVAMFIFEGNAAILNVRAECKDQALYPKILTSSMVVTVALFMSFATFAYSVYK